MEVEIRRGSVADAPVVARLLSEFNAEFGAPTPELSTLVARFQRMLTDPGAVVILAVCPHAGGFALVTLRPTPYSDGPLAQLDELYVVPALRGGGIGSRMLADAIEVAKRRGVQEMHINVDEVDDGARRFYERHGFVNIEPGNDYRMLCYLKEL